MLPMKNPAGKVGLKNIHASMFSDREEKGGASVVETKLAWISLIWIGGKKTDYCEKVKKLVTLGASKTFNIIQK